jgi:ABC-type Zn uptake system ZnuABC Zn-binding protein ZnuA
MFLNRCHRTLRLAVLALLLVFFGLWVPALHAGALPVVTSSSVIADFVRQVGGDTVQVRALAPAGSDPHTFQPTPDSMKTLSRARLIFFNGAGLEEWWEKTLRSAKRPEAVVIELSKGLATIRLPGHAGSSHSHSDGADPHVWLDPILVKVIADRIRDGLSQANPGGAAIYAGLAQAYRARLDELDAWIRSQIDTIPPGRRKIVTFHNAFQYFATRYGLAVKGYVVVSPGKEPSAKGLAELVRRIRQDQVPAVFAEADFNPKILETLGRDAGVTVVTNLYDGSLSAGPPADTYLNMMRHNTTQMVNALR